MRNIFIVSDTHWNHANILTFQDGYNKFIRTFHNLEEMNELMIENWNRVIGANDIVYHLGDVYFGPSDKADVILSRLNGKKRLLLGNHDDGKDPILHKHFQKIGLWRMFPEYNCVLTHVPVHESGLEKGKSKVHYNLHGHIHEKPAPSNQHVNCCVEKQNYTPKHIEDLVPKS